MLLVYSWNDIGNEELYFPITDKEYEFANPRNKDEVIGILEDERHMTEIANKAGLGSGF